MRMQGRSNVGMMSGLGMWETQTRAQRSTQRTIHALTTSYCAAPAGDCGVAETCCLVAGSDCAHRLRRPLMVSSHCPLPELSPGFQVLLTRQETNTLLLSVNSSARSPYARIVLGLRRWKLTDSPRCPVGHGNRDKTTRDPPQTTQVDHSQER